MQCVQERAEGPFTRTLLGIVAIDDAWGLIAFSMCLAVAKAIAGDGNFAIFGVTLWEIGGAVLVGGVIGVPAAFLTGRLKDGEAGCRPRRSASSSCAPVSRCGWRCQFLLAGMVAGAVIVNLATHHERAFHEIENIEWAVHDPVLRAGRGLV